MPGWESLIRITKSDSWGSAGTLGNRGYFLFADSESLDYGAQVVDPNKTLKQTAAELYVTRNTVKTQLRSIYQKLGINTREQANQWAQKTGETR